MNRVTWRGGNALFARLRRITTSGKFIPEIDGLRFIAIFSVLLFHVEEKIETRKRPLVEPLHTLLHQSNRGVRLFFVLSGFILVLPFIAHYRNGAPKVSLRRYFTRRVTRIEPPYLVSLAIAFILEVTLRPDLFSKLWPHLLASAFYVHTLVFGTLSPINRVTWSLEVEVQFYCLMPLLALIFVIADKRIRRGFLLAAMAATGLLSVMWTSHRAELSLIESLQFFLAGFLLADCYQEFPVSWWWDCVAIPSWIAVFAIPQRYLFDVVPFVMLVAYLASLRSRFIIRALRYPPITIIGGACYSIYLVHLVAMDFIFRWTWRLAHHHTTSQYYYVHQALILIPVSLLIGMVFYIFIERPCMDPAWPAKLRSRLRSTHWESGDARLRDAEL